MSGLPRWVGALALILALSAGAPASLPLVSPAAAADDAKASGHSASEKDQVLGLQPNLVFWSALVLILLLLVLRRYAWKPIMDALDERERKMEALHAAARDAQSEAAALQRKYEEELRQAADQVKAMVEEARRDAEATKADILRVANDEAAAIKRRAEQAIQLAKDDALHEIWNQASKLSVSIARSILARELNDDDQRRLVDAAVRELEAMKRES